MTPTWIATKRVILVHPDGRREPGHIAVGKPYVLGYPVDEDPGINREAKCPIEITGVHAARHAPSGAGTLGALLSAVHALGALARMFVERGGRILDIEDESEIDMETWFEPCPSKP